MIRQVFANPREHTLMSVRQLGLKLKVDPATALRIVKGMGFSSYRDFQHYLHELSIARATAIDTLPNGLDNGTNAASKIRAALQRDFDSLQNLRNTLDVDAVAAVAEKLHAARRVVVLAGDLADSLGSFLRYCLVVLGLPAVNASGVGQVLHTVASVGEGDVVIGISFGRGLRQTAEGLRQSRANKAYCIGITDTHLSPIARFSHECFITSAETGSFAPSYVAPMALLNVLILGCVMAQPKRTLHLIKKAAEEQKLGFRWYPDE